VLQYQVFLIHDYQVHWSEISYSHIAGYSECTEAVHGQNKFHSSFYHFFGTLCGLHSNREYLISNYLLCISPAIGKCIQIGLLLSLSPLCQGKNHYRQYHYMGFIAICTCMGGDLCGAVNKLHYTELFVWCTAPDGKNSKKWKVEYLIQE